MTNPIKHVFKKMLHDLDFIIGLHVELDTTNKALLKTARANIQRVYENC